MNIHKKKTFFKKSTINMQTLDRDPLFHCNRRNMPVSKDCTDCVGCPLKTYPSPCEQFTHYYNLVKRGKLGYVPDIFADITLPPDITE